jgi:ParB family transcriptional regulator, chromosome partitioning protein
VEAQRVHARAGATRPARSGSPAPDTASGAIPTRVPIDVIDPNPRNPRRRVTGIDELAESLRTHGLLQPPVVRPIGDRYELVAGHRRHAAAKALGWTDLPVLIRGAGHDEAYVLMLVENLQRDDLSPREEARALEVLLRERRWTTREVASAVRRSPAYVSKRLRVFEDPVLGPLVLNQSMTVSAAEEVLPLAQTEKHNIVQRALTEGWDSVRVRAEVRSRVARKHGQRSHAVQRQATDLRRALQGLSPSEMSDGTRRALQLLFHDLTVLARAPATQARVFPPLPQ